MSGWAEFQCDVVNKCVEHTHVPGHWGKLRMRTVDKVNGKVGPASQRPICLLPKNRFAIWSRILLRGGLYQMKRRGKYCLAVLSGQKHAFNMPHHAVIGAALSEKKPTNVAHAKFLSEIARTTSVATTGGEGGTREHTVKRGTCQGDATRPSRNVLEKPIGKWAGATSSQAQGEKANTLRQELVGPTQFPRKKSGTLRGLCGGVKRKPSGPCPLARLGRMHRESRSPRAVCIAGNLTNSCEAQRRVRNASGV